MRIQIEGPLVSIQKLIPQATWQLDNLTLPFLQPSGRELAKVAYRAIYGCEAREDVVNDMIVRDEYLGWLQSPPLRYVYCKWRGIRNEG